VKTSQHRGDTPLSAHEIDAQVLSLDNQLQELKRRIATLRRQRPAEEVGDYLLKHWSGAQVPLSHLFGGKQSLILIHNMGNSCSYCTMWADGFNGMFAHLSDRAAFAVTSPDEPAEQRAFAESRGWRFPMYSVQGTSLAKDMGFESRDDGLMPGVSIFQKSSGKIVRVNQAQFGPGDDFCPIWHFFELLPSGVDGWEPKDAY
jgi:predicted dithiol-disulfide oxidoreductase (DUF899 family)